MFTLKDQIEDNTSSLACVQDGEQQQDPLLQKEAVTYMYILQHPTFSLYYFLFRKQEIPLHANVQEARKKNEKNLCWLNWLRYKTEITVTDSDFRYLVRAKLLRSEYSLPIWLAS